MVGGRMSDDGMCPNCVTPWKCNGPHCAHSTVEPVTLWSGEEVGAICTECLASVPMATLYRQQIKESTALSAELAAEIRDLS